MGTATVEARDAVCTAAPPPANDPVQTCTLLRSRSWLKARGAYGLRFTGPRTVPQRHSHGGLGLHKDQQVASLWGVTRSPTVPWQQKTLHYPKLSWLINTRQPQGGLCWLDISDVILTRMPTLKSSVVWIQSNFKILYLRPTLTGTLKVIPGFLGPVLESHVCEVLFSGLALA